MLLALQEFAGKHVGAALCQRLILLRHRHHAGAREWRIAIGETAIDRHVQHAALAPPHAGELLQLRHRPVGSAHVEAGHDGGHLGDGDLRPGAAFDLRDQQRQRALRRLVHVDMRIGVIAGGGIEQRRHFGAQMRVQVEAGGQRRRADQLADRLQQVEFGGRVINRRHRAMQREIDGVPFLLAQAAEQALGDDGEGGGLDQAARRSGGAQQIMELPVGMLRLDCQRAADLGRRAGIEGARGLAAHPLARLKGREAGAERREAVRLVPQTRDGEFSFRQAGPPDSPETLAMPGPDA